MYLYWVMYFLTVVSSYSLYFLVLADQISLELL